LLVALCERDGMMTDLTVKTEPPGGGNGRKITLIALYSSSSIGLRYMASVLDQKGFDVSLVFFKDKDIALDLMERPSEREYELLVELVSGLAPDFIGMGVRSPFLLIAQEITSRLQRKLGRPVVWGATHPTVVPDDSIRHADIICLGEGEQAILELAEARRQAGTRTDIQNLWFRENGQVIRNPIRPLWADLDSLPFPNYGSRNKYFIQDEVIPGDPGEKAFNLDIITSRGCPYRCSYCSNSIFCELYHGKGSLIRRRSVRNVLDEIKTQTARLPALRRIDFIDEVFSWDKAWVEEFVEEYKRDVRLPFHCMQHPNTVDREIMKMLKDAGLERVEIGIQTGSERVRTQVFQRPILDKKLIETSRVMHDVGIVPFYDIIVDNPFETTQDKSQGLDLLLKIERPFHMHMFSLVYFPNTALTLKALAENLITESQVEGRATTCFDQFYVSLNRSRPAEDRFWLSLYSLTSKSFVPKGLIRLLSKAKILMRHPGPLVLFANTCNYLKLAMIALKWLIEGKPVFGSLKKRRKSAKQGSRIV
jgi:anaerobic magnesium-protoporphyrin IX monomethyl ester cyclase